MTSGEFTEHKFIAGMERKEEPESVTISTAQAFRLDALASKVEAVRMKSGEVADAAIRYVDTAMKTLGMRSDGYEDPDEDSPPVPPAIAISGNGHRRDWNRRRNAIIDALLIAGIIALVVATIGSIRSIDRFEAANAERERLYDDRFGNIARENARQDTELGRHDERLDRLEQQRRNAQPNN